MDVFKIFEANGKITRFKIASVTVDKDQLKSLGCNTKVPPGGGDIKLSSIDNKIRLA